MKKLKKLFVFMLVFGLALSFCSEDLDDEGTASSDLVDARDGVVYKTVKIGDQIWMAENLRATTYRDGTPISNVTNKDEWTKLSKDSTGAYAYYQNADSNVQQIGCLYNWYAVQDSRGIAPEGWHIPTDEEWKELEKNLGMDDSEADQIGWRGTNEGSKLKSDTEWATGNGSNKSGFSAVPVGYLHSDGTFKTDNQVYYWTATEYNASYAWYRFLRFSFSTVYRYNYGNKLAGFSIRCVKDN